MSFVLTPPSSSLPQSAIFVPEFLTPVDVLHLVPGLGDFSCCSRNHDFGDGKVAPCDLTAIAPILSSMIDAKVAYLWSQGKIFDARVVASVRHYFMRGLSDDMREDEPSQQVALDVVRESIRWRGDVMEAEETRRTGVGLLFWCAVADNVGACRAVLAACDDVNQRRAAANQATRSDRPDLFSLFQLGMTPLALACCIASWPVVEALLDAGADPMLSTPISKMDCSMGMTCWGSSWCIPKWATRFPDWDWQRKSAVGVSNVVYAGEHY